MINRLLAFLSVLIFALFVSQLVVANAMSGDGSSLKEMARQRDTLQKERRALKAEIAVLGSLSVIEEKAGSLGFVRRADAVDFLIPPKLARAP